MAVLIRPTIDSGQVTELSLSNGSGKYQSFDEDEIPELLEQLAFLMRVRIVRMNGQVQENPAAYAVE